MIAPLDLPVRRLFRSLSLSVPWRGGSNGSGTDTATIATGAGANADTSSHYDNFAAAVELQAWPIPPSSSASSSTTTTPIPRTITTLAEDEESFPYQDKDQLTRPRMHSARPPLREKYPHHQLPPIRSRASSRGSFESSRSRSSSTTSSTLSGDGLTVLKQPQERQRACEDCWKEFWG
ncbi:uncharacterized protein PG986_010788 [Apiospora aurea]|uniref:Uncharacterized protein n=1 Tax=Apiospora aurea TaxID=335848 RepID=A0ABR1Q3C6_9PEZI